MPTFYVEKLHVSTAVAGLHMSSLHILAFILLMLAKDRVDKLISSGSLTTLRLRQLSIAGGYGIVCAGAVTLSILTSWHRGGLSLLSLPGSLLPLPSPSPLFYTVAQHLIWAGLTLQTFGKSPLLLLFVRSDYDF